MHYFYPICLNSQLSPRKKLGWFTPNQIWAQGGRIRAWIQWQLVHKR